MLNRFRSNLFARVFAVTTLGISVLFVVMYVLAVPYIQSTVAAIEERSGHIILDNIHEMVEKIRMDLENGRQGILQERKTLLRSVIEVVTARAHMLDQQVRAGQLSRKQAKDMLLDELRHINYGRNDYVFASNYQSVLIAYPDPALNGADFSKQKDSRGNLIVPPMVEGALQHGEGYYSYWWRRLGEQEPTEKLSYYKRLPAFDLVVCSGVYLEDVEVSMLTQRVLAIEKLRQQLHATHIAKTGYVYIFDGNDYMLIHPNANIEGTKATHLTDHATGKPLFPMLKAVADQPAGLHYKWDSPADPGNYVYTKISWVRYVKEMDWYISSSVYVDELDESALILRNRVLGVFVVVMLLSIVLVYFFVKRLTHFQIAEERLKFALEGSNDGVWDWDLQKNNVFFSKVWREMFGYAESDVISTEDWLRMIHPDDLEIVRATIEKHLAGKIPPPAMEYRFQCKDTSWKWTLGRGKVVSRNDTGRPLRMVGTNSDIGERKRMEAELVKTYEELKELDQLKSDFLSTVSHELRTPMTSVVGFVKLVRKKLEKTVFPQLNQDPKMSQAIAQVRQNLDIVITESERLTLLINDVLDSAKLDAGKVEWNFVSVQPQRLIERASAVTATLIEQSGLELVSSVEPKLPAVRGDENRLLQVLINLLGNAVKFTDSGQISLRAQREGESIRFSVQDSGCGIAEEDQGKVFDKFKQIGDTLTDKPKGTGLGLSICQLIVKHHGGSIGLESTPGFGSTFYFTVPIDKSL